MGIEPENREARGSTAPLNVMQLNPGMENVTVRVRVLETSEPRTIDTKRGARTISNAIVGDSTGRVEAVLWGEKAGALKTGDVVEINGAWVTEFRGRVQLNVGRSTNIKQISGDSVPETVPESQPRATGRSGSFGRRGFQRRRSMRSE
ncbi:MAG: OB-fold nucleic acid binding domain-containing protein [Desulfurococcaceae archaeon]